MDSLRIPFVLWLPGDPPPDLTGLRDAVCIPVVLRGGRVGAADGAGGSAADTETDA